MILFVSQISQVEWGRVIADNTDDGFANSLAIEILCFGEVYTVAVLALAPWAMPIQKELFQINAGKVKKHNYCIA
jgi:hypothetical protein